LGRLVGDDYWSLPKALCALDVLPKDTLFLSALVRSFFSSCRETKVDARGARGCHHAPSFGRALSSAVHIPASGWAQPGLLHNAKLREALSPISVSTKICYRTSSAESFETCPDARKPRSHSTGRIEWYRTGFAVLTPTSPRETLSPAGKRDVRSSESSAFRCDASAIHQFPHSNAKGAAGRWL
jgi:hypothetical protein